MLVEVPESVCCIDPWTTPHLQRAASIAQRGAMFASLGQPSSPGTGTDDEGPRISLAFACATKASLFSNKIDQSGCRCRGRTPLRQGALAGVTCSQELQKGLNSRLKLGFPR